MSTQDGIADPENRAPGAIAWRRLFLLLLAAAPLLVQWAMKTRLWPRPFWIHFYDPESIYFYEGLRLIALSLMAGTVLLLATLFRDTAPVVQIVAAEQTP